jgi:hypothetical protein
MVAALAVRSSAMLSVALSTTIQLNPDRLFHLKAEEVQTQMDNFRSICYNPSEADFIQPIYRMIVSHGDCVETLPENATRIASSNSCVNEMYVCGKENNILACQSHPEFEYKYTIEERIWPAVVDLNHRLTDDQITESKACIAAIDDQYNESIEARIYLRDNPAEATLLSHSQSLYSLWTTLCMHADDDAHIDATSIIQPAVEQTSIHAPTETAVRRLSAVVCYRLGIIYCQETFREEAKGWDVL